VNVSSWVGSGTGFRTDTTGFTRSVSSGSQITLSAPATLPGGRYFQYWLLDAGPYIYGTLATVSMDGPHALLAIYGNSAPAPRTLTGLAISGPSSVNERSAAAYQATATFSDGSSASVIPAWAEDSIYATISGAGVLDAEAVSSDRSVAVEATYTSGGVTRVATKGVTIRNTDAAATYTLSRNVVGGGSIGYSPQATNYAAGTVVSLHGNEGDGYVFSHWSGDASGTDDDTTVVMNGNRSVTAHFTVDLSVGNLRVNLSPPQAVAEGAAWKYHLFTAWRPSGDLQDGITPRTDKTISFKDIPGWITPDSVKASVIGGQTTVVNAPAYREILGAVQVTITPAQAAQAGARWRLNGGAWRESGTTLADAPTGAGTIDFLAVAGWTTPPAQAITVARGLTTTRSGDYTPPAGFPIVTSVAPRTGPIAGGTTVTFEGANFQPGATVTFGGVPATSVAVVSATRLTAVTPPRASYGTVPLVLTSGGQTVTQANGFSYLEPLGQNIELVGQLGGEFKAVDVQGSYAYLGEGTAFVVFDISNPLAPIERGRIALPGFVESIAVSGGKAYIAAGSSGLYVLDVSSPSAPLILGLFDTVDYAYGVAVDGTIAYAACSGGGLYVFDVTNSSAPTLLSRLDTPGRAERVRSTTVAGRKYAFVADTSGGTRVIDVTLPAAPAEVSFIAAANTVGTQDVRVAGTTLYVGGFGTGVQVFDVATPEQPVFRGAYTNTTADCLDVSGTTVYVCDGLLRVLNASNPATPTLVGTVDLGSFPAQIRVSGGYAFIAFGREGVKIVSISNPASPVLRSTVFGLGRVVGVAVSGSVAVTGNDNGGMDTVDVSNPARPVKMGHLGTERVSNIAIRGTIAALVNYGDEMVSIVDIALPQTPVLRSTYTAVDGWDVAYLGANVVLASQSLGSTPKPRVDVLSVSNPASPQNIGGLELSGSAGSPSGISFSGNWGYVTRPNQALDILKFASPTNPQFTGRVVLSGFLHGAAATADSNHVFVADSGNGVHIVNATNKAAPSLVRGRLKSRFRLSVRA
jgi:uncharacterized repeat protein (TIGR02543 family)